MSNGSGLHCYECSNGLWIVPGSTKMIRIDNYLQEQMQPKMVLAKCFRKPVIYSQIENDGSVTFNDGDLTEVFDYIFIDCPPALSDSTYNAMGVATSLLIPVPTESLALTALGAIIEQYKAVKDDLNPELVIRGILPVMIDERPNIARMVIQVLKQQYGDVFIPKKIRRCIKVNESQMQKKDIYEYSPYCTAALDYEVVTKYLFNIK
jgi:chromosome partitioning protein